MKLTKRQLKTLIEGMFDDMSLQTTGHGEEPGYGDPNLSPHLGLSPDLEEPGVHPSRQIGTGQMDSQGMDYWGNYILDKLNQGTLDLDKLLDRVAGDAGDSDESMRDSILSDLMIVISKSDQIELDEDLNIIAK
tara:strand:- start:352 stop:753 length:402 start_codon:yes stop_codon:yes gene_type:complete